VLQVEYHFHRRQIRTNISNATPHAWDASQTEVWPCTDDGFPKACIPSDPHGVESGQVCFKSTLLGTQVLVLVALIELECFVEAFVPSLTR